jgi:hypothetical protein
MADEKTVPAAMARAVAHLQQGDWQAAHLIVQDDQTPLASALLAMPQRAALNARMSSRARPPTGASSN